jgi:4-carboxymuconolactone decarboxylase
MRLTSLLLVLLTAVAVAQSDLNPDSHARLPYLQRKDMSDADLKTFDVLPGKGKDDVLRGPLAFAAYNPAVAKALFDLHNAAVAGSLTPRTRELAIMVACRETNYNLEWNGHEATALKNGVDAKVIDVIRKRAAVTGVDEKDAIVIRFGRQLFTDKKVDSATYAKIVDIYGKKGAMDLVAVMITYADSGFYGIAVNEQPAPGKPAL